jgi:hypothetical protein
MPANLCGLRPTFNRVWVATGRLRELIETATDEPIETLERGNAGILPNT